MAAGQRGVTLLLGEPRSDSTDRWRIGAKTVAISFNRPAASRVVEQQIAPIERSGSLANRHREH